MRRYVPLRFDIVVCLLIAFAISLGTAKLVGLALPALYGRYVEEDTIAQGDVGGPAGEDYYSSDHILPVGRVVFEDLTAYPDLLEQIQRRAPLSRTDFYVDMSGTGGLVYEDEYDSRWTGVVQTVTVVICFPILHSIGAKLGLFPRFFPPKKEREAQWE